MPLLPAHTAALINPGDEALHQQHLPQRVSWPRLNWPAVWAGRRHAQVSHVRGGVDGLYHDEPSRREAAADGDGGAEPGPVAAPAIHGAIWQLLETKLVEDLAAQCHFRPGPRPTPGRRAAPAAAASRPDGEIFRVSERIRSKYGRRK